MLKKENRVIVIVLLVLGFSSCQRKTSINVNGDVLREYHAKHFHEYKTTYETCVDSLEKWIEDSLQVSQPIFLYEWQLDSALCFNTDSSRLFSTINLNTGRMKSANSDNIMEFGGAKIDGEWYFFFISSSMTVPREYYKKDIYEPLTFQELSRLSHNEIMKKFINRQDDGSFVPNEERFKLQFFDAWSSGCKDCTSVSDFDSMILASVGDKYNYKLNPKEINEIKEEMANSKRPEQEKKWWQIW